MNKWALLTGEILASSLLSSDSNSVHDYMPTLIGKCGSTQRKYTNKNANIEYYTDEKGNIRRRKIGGK